MSDRSTHETGRRLPSRPPGTPSPGSSLMRLTIAFALIFLVARVFLGGEPAGRELSYTRFVKLVDAGRVTSVTLHGQRVRGRLAAADSTAGESGANARFTTHVPEMGDDTLLPALESHEVEVHVEPAGGTSWWVVISAVLPLLVLVLFGFLIFRSARGQGKQLFSLGRSKAKLYERTDESTGFDDVAGAEGPKSELREIVDFLSDPARFQKLGGSPPKGVLLTGPPGTGKTLLARASAGEAEVPFFSITGSDFMEMFVGIGASRVRSLFADARRAAPSIIFIDELDSIGRRRGAGLGGGHDEREQTLNQLLSEMDGFEPNAGVIVMSATNRPDILDPALLRPGRFDRRIAVPLPTVAAREAILRIHARNKVLADDVDLQRLAEGTPGFSGAELANLLNEAALIAARDGKDAVGPDDVEEARDKIMLGLEREGLALTREECRILAYHEGGHAIVAALVKNADPVHKVTIVPRGNAMGNTQTMPRRERYVTSREMLTDRMTILMGGRVAEELVLETATTGAENDLKQATHIARRMVMDWGMGDTLLNIAFGSERQEVFLGEDLVQGRSYGDETAGELDDAVKTIVRAAHDAAHEILVENRDALDAVAEALLEEEQLDGEEVVEIIEASRTKRMEV